MAMVFNNILYGPKTLHDIHYNVWQEANYQVNLNNLSIDWHLTYIYRHVKQWYLQTVIIDSYQKVAQVRKPFLLPFIASTFPTSNFVTGWITRIQW